jgi:hypothetical protein
VDLALGTLELTTLGGVGTYLVTVAEQLERMGHRVTILAEDTGDMAAVAEGHGLRVVAELGELPDACDAIYAQDAPSAYALAERYPGVPQAFCVHTPDHDRWLVPQLPGVTSLTLALDEPAARYARSLANVPEVALLSQPVDTRRFAPRGSIGTSPRRALALGNYASGNRLRLVSEACTEAGIELVQRGLQASSFTAAPESDINDSDIVVGRSRVIVEAMACGRAAYVYDEYGGGGWVTPDRYSGLAADGFGSRGTEANPVDAARLRKDLRAYRAEMGPINRDLAVAHHGARGHCEELVRLFRQMAPESRPAAPLDEVRRLTRVQWQADSRALGFEHEAKMLRAELAQLGSETRELRETTADAKRRAAEAERRARVAEREAAVLRGAHRALASISRPVHALRRWRRANR